MILKTIYDAVLVAVESEIQLPDNWILSSKSEDSTDARYILCGILHEQGLSSHQIQQMTGLRKSTVNKMLASINERLDRRKITKVWWLQIGRKLNANEDGNGRLCDYLCG